jgi:hypothetical protein
MSPLPLLEWFRDTPLAQTIRNSSWLLPTIESGHLVGYGLLIGTILAVDLRLLGLGVRRQTAPQIAGELAPWTLGGLVLTIVTGVLLFSYDPLKFYANHAFPYKVALLAAAVAFHYTAHREVTLPNTSGVKSLRNRLAAGVSLALWLGVALAGLAISLQPF